MAYLFVLYPMNLDDLQGHSLNAGLIKCNSTNIFATFSTVLTTHGASRGPSAIAELLVLGALACRPNILVFCVLVFRTYFDIFDWVTGRACNPRKKIHLADEFI